ncbi:hypothetical protein GCM10022420_046960 [Streptomyces iranensis]
MRDFPFSWRIRGGPTGWLTGGLTGGLTRGPPAGRRRAADGLTVGEVPKTGVYANLRKGLFTLIAANRCRGGADRAGRRSPTWPVTPVEFRQGPLRAICTGR